MRCVAVASTQRQTGLAWTLGRAWLFGGLLLIACSDAAIAARMKVQVVGVTDGDTIVVLDSDKVQHKVRLAGIDAPERRQAFGTRSHQALASAVFRKTVVLDWNKKDRYGRLVAKVLLSDRDVGLELVAAGLAWHFKAYQREQDPADRTRYSNAERDARSANVGLWSDPRPIPPWVFRANR